MSAIKSESKSNWECVSQKIQGQKPIVLGQGASHCFLSAPDGLLSALSYYKFAAKMIGKKQRVLDLRCYEGLGTYVVAKECGFAKGMDRDERAVEIARSNFPEPNLQFAIEGFGPERWDAVIRFEDCFGEKWNPPLRIDDSLWSALASQVTPQGLVIVGGRFPPSSDVSSPFEKAKMGEFFTYIFPFSAVRETVYPGYLPSASYHIAIGCKKR